MAKTNIFKKENILTEHSFMLEELLEARTKGEKLCDFLPNIRPSEYHKKDNITGKQILDNWMEHFKKKRVPFAVTNINGTLTMWKINEV